MTDLKRIREQFEQGENPTYLMNQMERIFKVSSLNDEVYNAKNPEVIKLYQEISNSRSL